MVCVPRNLVARVPDAVRDDEAVFTIVGAVGLHGIRFISPTLNERVVVIGLGLIGLLTAQLLKLNGCQVIGIEREEAKCQLAEQLGITVLRTGQPMDVVKAVLALTNAVGADGVIDHGFVPIK